MIQKPLTDQGIILKSIPVRESDVILTILTHTHGKLSAIARGARRSKKRFMGGIDVFDYGLFCLEPTRTELFSVTSLTERQPWLGLRNNLQKFSLASFCLEVAGEFAHDGDKAAGVLLEPLLAVLQKLNSQPNPTDDEISCVQFLLKILHKSGFDAAEHFSSLPLPTLTWWTTLTTNETQPLPPEHTTTTNCFALLCRYTESITTRALKSRKLLTLSRSENPVTNP